VRALVITPQPFFTPRGTPFSVYYRTAVTAELGIQVDLLTYGEGKDVNLPGVRIVRIPRFRALGEVGVGPSLLKLFLDQFVLLWAIGLLLRHRYDFVHAHEEAALFCRFLKPIFGFKLIYDMHSSLPQQLDNFRFTSSRILIGLFRWLEGSALAACDVVITICPELAKYVEALGVDPGKHFLIENSLFDPVRLVGGGDAQAEQPPSQLAELPASAPLLIYAGTLEPYQGIDLLLRAFQKLLGEIPDAQLVVVGGLPSQVADYRKLVDDLDLASSVRFLGRVPQQVAQAASARATAHVSPRISGTNTPLKLYQLLASGIPIVATDIRSHTQVLSEEVAFLAPPEPDALAAALALALGDSELGRRRADRARRLYEERYSREIYTSRMSSLFRRLA
jgi:glycosyltransferase involved in cell wall biosynthesis